MGFKGDLDAAMPRQKRQVLFGQGELARSLIRELRDAEGPMTSRELAQAIVALKGDDVRDRKMIRDYEARLEIPAGSPGSRQGAVVCRQIWKPDLVATIWENRTGDGVGSGMNSISVIHPAALCLENTS